MTILLITLPVRDVVFTLVLLDLEVLRGPPIVFGPHQLTPSIQDHWTRVWYRVASRRQERVPLVALCTGGRNLNDSRLLIEGDEALRGSKPMKTQIVPTQPQPKSKSNELRHCK